MGMLTQGRLKVRAGGRKAWHWRAWAAYCLCCPRRTLSGAPGLGSGGWVVRGG